ncbi:hypothetical protein Pla86_43850 [Planctomycetes bacterium Pla86]|uniref:Uncharacterized protein n=1 Tax=Engelhardtia mirabilis TaxID=2528011 RepID=A0A518BQL1_9BACT|nr:hypothetical protein Pla133_43860 [Planctomycetes bacterium Pla133]QDV03594.1 hypothetical protein Pla86_43850 [Planctomycetes bacterium Pla86]
MDTIEGAPECLWARGRVELLAGDDSARGGPRVAIVGSRGPSPYGQDQARRFSAWLAARGATIVSGLARGVDSVAHAAALDVGGDTIAVLGSGVDRPWPAGPLAERVASEGLLLSEFEPGTPPAKHHFPQRNRLISGLSAAVVVIEGAFRSGSLITARWAADQGREVFALPGRVDQPLARGCHRLLREGAALVEDPGELAEILGLGAAPCHDGSADSVAEVPLLAALQGETSTAGELATRLARPLNEVLTDLALLELEGRVARAPGGLYRRVERGPTDRGRSARR